MDRVVFVWKGDVVCTGVSTFETVQDWVEMQCCLDPNHHLTDAAIFS